MRAAQAAVWGVAAVSSGELVAVAILGFIAGLLFMAWWAR